MSAMNQILSFFNVLTFVFRQDYTTLFQASVIAND